MRSTYSSAHRPVVSETATSCRDGVDVNGCIHCMGDISRVRHLVKGKQSRWTEFVYLRIVGSRAWSVFKCNCDGSFLESTAVGSGEVELKDKERSRISTWFQ